MNLFHIFIREGQFIGTINQGIIFGGKSWMTPFVKGREYDQNESFKKLTVFFVIIII